MSQLGFKGISFPFRIGVKGGVVTSSTSVSDVTHIVESIRQILGTRRFERTMEFHLFSDVDTQIFESNDVSTYTILEYQVKEALKLEPRIEVVSVKALGEANRIIVDIVFTVPAYGSTFATKVKVGEDVAS